MPPPPLTLSHPTTTRVACPISHSSPTDTYTPTPPCRESAVLTRALASARNAHTYARTRTHTCTRAAVCASAASGCCSWWRGTRAFRRRKTRRIVVRKRERGGGGRGRRAGGAAGGRRGGGERRDARRGGEGSRVACVFRRCTHEAMCWRCGHACGGKRDPSEERTRDETKEREVTSPQGLSRRLSATTRGVTPSSSSSDPLLSRPPRPFLSHLLNGATL